MRNAIKNLQFKVSPLSIDITNGRFEPTTLKMEFGGYQAGNISLESHLSPDQIEYLIGWNHPADAMWNEYIITIEKVVKEDLPHELLDKAARCAKLGSVKGAVELAVKALQKMTEAK